MKNSIRWILLTLFILLCSGSVHAQSPLTFDLAPCQASTSIGNCGSIPTSLPYTAIYIPSTSTSTQTLPAAGVPFYEPDYPTLTPYTSPCGIVSFVCGERLFDSNDWAALNAMVGGNPCPGAGTYTGVPGTNTASGSDVLTIGRTFNPNIYTALILTNPGSSCLILKDVNMTTGALTNLRVSSGLLTGGAGEIHADYNNVSTWYGGSTPNTMYQIKELNSSAMTVSLLVDLSLGNVMNFPIALNDPAVIGGAGWETSSGNGMLCGQLGPQDYAIGGVCYSPADNCAVWWRTDTGDVGHGSACVNFFGSPPQSCSGCAPLPPSLSNACTIVSITGNGTTATGTVAASGPCATAFPWLNGAQHITIQGNASFNGREIPGLVFSYPSFTFNSSVMGTQSGGTIGQQLGLHGGGPCQDGVESSWSYQGFAVIGWAPGTTNLWNISGANGQGHRTCGNHTLVVGKSQTSGSHWLTFDMPSEQAAATNGAGKLPSNVDGHYFWPANSSDTSSMYAMNYCLNQSGCPNANPNCPGCGEVNAVLPLASGGLTYRAFQTRKNACANGPCSNAYFYDEVSGQCTQYMDLCYFSTNWADTSTGIPTLGSVTQGAQTVYRNDIVLVFMPLNSYVPAPSRLIIAKTYDFKKLLTNPLSSDIHSGR